MSKKLNESKELLSLNSEMSEFNLTELENRLETDPLAVGGLLDLASTSDPVSSQLGDCVEDHSCGCDGCYFAYK